MDQNVINMEPFLQPKYFAEDEIPRTGSVHPEFSHTMMICVDAFEDRLAQGRIHTYYFDDVIPFNSLDQMLFGIEDILDRSDEAQRDTQLKTSFERPRSTSMASMSDEEFYAELEKSKQKKMPPAYTPETIHARAGKLASYYIRILARQHSSMQGVISRYDRGGTATFRSEMELLTLIRADLVSEEVWGRGGAVV